METVPGRGERGRFTLVQVLIVIAMILIVVSLLLAAVVRVRETAARLTTVSHFAQMGLALQNFDSAKGGLPHAFGTEKLAGTDGPRPVQFHILPYIEQDRYFNATAVPTTGTVQMYQDPSRGGPGFLNGSGATCDYAVNACIFGNGTSADFVTGTANTDPLGTNTDMRPAVVTSKGVNTNRTSWSVEALTKSPRGTSNLIFAGQKQMSTGNYETRGGGDHGINFSNDDLQRGTTAIGRDPDGTATVYAWGGPHIASTMFLKADGSVISLRYSTSPAVMAAAQDPKHASGASLSD